MNYLIIHGKSNQLLWHTHNRIWKDCKACELCKTRHLVSLLRGHFPAKMLFIAEAPGDYEDTQGYPMVGPTYDFMLQHTNRIDDAGIRWAITNTLGCQPPGNRNPTQGELKACRPRLDQLVNYMAPEVIVTLGAVAASVVTRYDLPWVELKHPAYVLRVQNKRSVFEADLELNRFSQGIDRAIELGNR